MFRRNVYYNKKDQPMGQPFLLINHPDSVLYYERQGGLTMARKPHTYAKYDRATKSFNKVVGKVFKSVTPKRRKKRKGCGLAVLALIFLTCILFLRVKYR
jgi:hypothetical protein